jgi:folylpolyglutamate synthase
MRDYQHAVQLLNSLQSNSATLIKIKSRGNNLNSLPEMVTFLSRIGYHPTDLDSMNVIHVAGTKGKGSTCSFVQSILSQSKIDGKKVKTGLYSSPHIMEVRERIRINGEPLSKLKFAEYFFNVWDRLEATKDAVEAHLQKPAYFRYMTLMCFHAFKQENVDAAILEVGVGGEYDSTNIVPNPIVTAISSLGLDHQAVLGNTIEEIAWHKAGIIKVLC